MLKDKKQTDHESDQPRGWDLPAGFSMPTSDEIEQVLALGDSSWTLLLAAAQPAAEPMPRSRGMAAPEINEDGDKGDR